MSKDVASLLSIALHVKREIHMRSLRRFNKGHRKVQEGSRRFEKAQEGSRRLNEVQEGSRKFKEVHFP